MPVRIRSSTNGDSSATEHGTAVQFTVGMWLMFLARAAVLVKNFTFSYLKKIMRHKAN
jgi:hypothetical protein